jgi:5'-3' exonuclease
MLEEYEEEWTKERNQCERDSDTMTDEMKEEVMTLLRLFGVPYVESPAEAEAQCAALEQMGLVNGIVTEDSDVFVFGGKKIYKNIFDERLYAEAYIADDAEREMSLGRNAMVALAMLLGSDYTDGVKGVGIVNSMEVLRAFDVSQDLKEGLQSFRTWLDGVDLGDLRSKETPASEYIGSRKVFHAKHKSARSRWIPPEHFPAENVIRYVIGGFLTSRTSIRWFSHTCGVSPIIQCLHKSSCW